MPRRFLLLSPIVASIVLTACSGASSDDEPAGPAPTDPIVFEASAETKKDLGVAKWGFDDAYDSFVRNGVNGVVDTSELVLWKKVDAGWIDGVVNGLAQMTNDFSQGGKLLQNGLVRGSALSILAGAVALLSAILWAGK